MINSIKKILDGYKLFYEEHFITNPSLYKNLSTNGQFPKILVIACSDSRVDPAIIMNVSAGDIFVIRNIANLVPTYKPSDIHDPVSSGIEFAVNHLRVEHIVILGHSQCDGIRALWKSEEDFVAKPSFIPNWVGIAKEIKSCSSYANNSEIDFNIYEQKGIMLSIKNLLTFPWIKEKVHSKMVSLHGWHFSIHDGTLRIISKNKFKPYNF